MSNQQRQKGFWENERLIWIYWFAFVIMGLAGFYLDNLYFIIICAIGAGFLGVGYGIHLLLNWRSHS